MLNFQMYLQNQLGFPLIHYFISNKERRKEKKKEKEKTNMEGF